MLPFFPLSSAGAGASLLPETTRLAERIGRTPSPKLFRFPCERRFEDGRIGVNRAAGIISPRKKETEHHVADD
jgi:hypothetical protein